MLKKKKLDYFGLYVQGLMKLRFEIEFDLTTTKIQKQKYGYHEGRLNMFPCIISTCD